MRKRLAILCCCAVFCGCMGPTVAVRETTSDLDVKAKAFAPEAHRANIYVYRDSGFRGSGVNFPILLNGCDVGAISMSTFLLLSVPPGAYEISLPTGWGPFYGGKVWHAEVGKQYFVAIRDHSWMYGGWNIESVAESEGQRAVRDRTRAEATIDFGQPETHIPSKPERTFQFVLRTEPRSAKVIVQENGIERVLGTTPYNFRLGLAGRYERWPVRVGDSLASQFLQQGYVLFVEDFPLATLRQIGPENLAPELHLKCTLIAEGFGPQPVERVITFKRPCSPWDANSWTPAQTNLVVGLAEPTKPEYVVKVKIDSIPAGADIYAFGAEGYLGEKLGATPSEFEVGFANRRSPATGEPNLSAWSIWRPTKEEGFVTWPNEKPPNSQLNFVLLKEGYARQDVTRWSFHTPDVTNLQNVQKTITIPLKTPEEARQERIDRIEEARTQLAAALKKTELDLKQAEISNQQELIRQQELISRCLAQLNTAMDRVNSSPAGTITVRQDQHYNREWQDSMAALGSIMRPYSPLSPIEREQHIQGLEGLGSLIDLMNR